MEKDVSLRVEDETQDGYRFRVYVREVHPGRPSERAMSTDLLSEADIRAHFRSSDPKDVGVVIAEAIAVWQHDKKIRTGGA